MNEAAAPVTAVIFDWGGTLTPWHDVDLTRQWQVFANALHPSTPDLAVELADRILAIEDHAWQQARAQRRSARIAEILAEAGVSGAESEYDAALAAYTSFWEEHTITSPEVAPLWTWLREQGIAVGVLSNTIWTREQHRSYFARDGVLHLIDGDVYTSEIEVAKPHPEAFRVAARAVSAEPQECVFVGDRLFEDVHGPHQVGMRAIWVPHSTIPTAQQVPVEDRPDAVAHGLIEIAGILTGWGWAG